jgi:hypothetical protein
VSNGAGLQLTAAAIHANKGRTRTLVLVVLAGALILLYFMLRPPQSVPERMQAGALSTAMPNAPSRSGKDWQCSADTDCPDMTFCNSRHLCVPDDARAALAPPLLPRVKIVRDNASGASVGAALGRAVDRVLGRGRGGEGAETVRTSDERKGQQP